MKSKDFIPLKQIDIGNILAVHAHFSKLARYLKCIWHEPVESHLRGLLKGSPPERYLKKSNLTEGLQTQKRQ